MDKFVSFLFYVSLLIWVGMEAWVLLREWGKIERKRDNNSRRIIFFGIFISMIVGNYFANAPYFRLSGNKQGHFLLGSIIIFLGVVFRFWAIQTLGSFFRTTVMIQKGQKVVKSGPYRLLRHPSYTGALLSVFGIGISLGNLLGLLIMIIIVFWVMYQRIIVEEKELQHAMGKEYVEYMKETKRLIPFIY